jgi:GNAT superfamily N-acetyltransferase
MARIALPILPALLAFGAAACGGSDAAPAAESPPPSSAAAKAPVACEPARVHYTPYPGGDERRLQIPWIAGKPAALGLVGLLWYWPDEWRRQRVEQARIYTGGVAPQGWNVKILWAFVAPSAKGQGGGEVLVEGHRLDGPGRFEARFSAIGYAGQQGAPSYASIIDVPRPGCWRLTLSTGELKADVDVRAEDGAT